MGATLSDFWWLNDDQLNRFIYLLLDHREPEDDLELPTKRVNKCRISSIDEFRNKHKNINVYRGLELSDSQSNGEKLIGPFLVDIDNDNNLDATYSITKHTFEYLVTQLDLSPTSDFRIFFTGHKGFNIEVKPSVLMADIYIGKQGTCYREKRRDIINYLHEINDIPKNHYNFVDNNETVIDVQHDYIRLHDSINSWVGDNGKIVSRRKIELSYQDLLEKSIEDIVVASEV